MTVAEVEEKVRMLARMDSVLAELAHISGGLAESLLTKDEKAKLARVNWLLAEDLLTEEEQDELAAKGYGSFLAWDTPREKYDDSSTDPFYWTEEKFSEHLRQQQDLIKEAREIVKRNPYLRYVGSL